MKIVPNIIANYVELQPSSQIGAPEAHGNVVEPSAHVAELPSQHVGPFAPPPVFPPALLSSVSVDDDSVVEVVLPTTEQSEN